MRSDDERRDDERAALIMTITVLSGVVLGMVAGIGFSSCTVRPNECAAVATATENLAEAMSEVADAVALTAEHAVAEQVSLAMAASPSSDVIGHSDEQTRFFDLEGREIGMCVCANADPKRMYDVRDPRRKRECVCMKPLAGVP